MEYDKEAHLPQQIEVLFQLKASGEVEKFEAVLDNIKLIMRDRNDFIDGINLDIKKKEEDRNDLMVETKKAALKALEDKDIMNGLAQVEYILSSSKEGYGNILNAYMHDVMTTCMSYNRGSVEEETVE